LIRRLVVFLLLGVLATDGWAELRLFIVDSEKPEGAPELVAVESEQNEGSKVVLQQSNGTKREVSKGSILARLPASPGPGDVLTRESAAKAISDLLEAKSKAPALEKVLQEEVEKWKACLDRLPSEEDPGALAKAGIQRLDQSCQSLARRRRGSQGRTGPLARQNAHRFFGRGQGPFHPARLGLCSDGGKRVWVIRGVVYPARHDSEPRPDPFVPAELV